MNRRRKLLILLLFCGVMFIVCDDKLVENVVVMMFEVGVVIFFFGLVNVLSELFGRIVFYEVVEICFQVGGIIIKCNFIEGDKVNQGDLLYQIDFVFLQVELNFVKGLLVKVLFIVSNVCIIFNCQVLLLKINYVSCQDYDIVCIQLNEVEVNVIVVKVVVEQVMINL